MLIVVRFCSLDHGPTEVIYGIKFGVSFIFSSIPVSLLLPLAMKMRLLLLFLCLEKWILAFEIVVLEAHRFL